MDNKFDTTSSFDIVRHIIGDKWKFLIICYLFDRPLRFGELLRMLEPISKKVLRENLLELENLYILNRVQTTDCNSLTVYALSDLGHSLQPILNELMSWSLHYSVSYRQRQQQHAQQPPYTDKSNES